MKNLFSSKSSSLSPQLRTGLAISMIVVLIIAIAILIATLVIKKRLVKKITNPDEQAELAKLKIKNPNYGIVLNGIKKYYENAIANDFFVAFLINTIYLNKYQNILINDKNDYLAISSAALASSNVLYDNSGNKNLIKYQEIVKEFPDLSELKLSYELPNEKKYDLIFSADKSLKIEDHLEKYLQFLADKGMMIIAIGNYDETKAAKAILKDYQLRYENLKFGNEKVLILAHDEIQSKFSEE
ncbi:BC85_0335 family putative methyltransferase [Mycoplasma phocoeninasale]|uniref:BC85_0335 family putative methyltransferase n=1 Tax=Mycoplasma phocoeninasale TaxID=2726117 RepID=UPI001967A2AA|nr:hypothetical protein [Mycoplasma phocoeninasale]MBN0970935.1 hypothetical protein [Mycoplasma phocoeninasale]